VLSFQLLSFNLKPGTWILDPKPSVRVPTDALLFESWQKVSKNQLLLRRAFLSREDIGAFKY